MALPWLMLKCSDKYNTLSAQSLISLHLYITTLAQRFRHNIYLLIVLLTAFQFNTAFSQCTNVSVLPYTEDFELNNGGWTTGGQSTDWVWGTPAKPIINSAASGNNCWIVGGLTGSSYASNEASWIQSPCFDFTAVTYPIISFKVFWETEKGYDGASLQYSLDGGGRWSDVGNANSNSNCLNSNWYNTSSIRFLGGLNNSQVGWSGSTQSSSGGCVGGGGSGGWVVAKHVLPAVGNKANVIFRFVFGAGSTCNSYNGFAVDDFTISEAPANVASFTYACGNNNDIVFTNTSTPCPTTFEWNFDDVSSGSTNTSALANPTHTFVDAGTHRVRLIVSSAFNQPDTAYVDVTTIAANAKVTKEVSCNGYTDGEATVTVVGVTSGISYLWDTDPSETQATATGLSAGTFSVIVSAAGVCNAKASVRLNEPTKITSTTSIKQPGCGYAEGQVAISTTGGNPDYTYSWSPNVGNTAIVYGLSEGNYTVTVRDKNLCSEIVPIEIRKVYPPTVSIINIKDVQCFGDKTGSATVSINNGLPPYAVRWSSAPLDTAATVNNLKAGLYSVLVYDSNFCKVTVPFEIKQPPAIKTEYLVTHTTCNEANGKIILAETNSTNTYAWFPTVSYSFTALNINEGIYAVEITNSNGCKLVIDDIRVINKGNAPHPILGKDTIICSNDAIVLFPGVFNSYLWNDGSQASQKIVQAPGKYWVKVTNQGGCTSTDTINVKTVDNCVDIYFPTTFSPNNDGLNDTYGPVGNLSLVTNYQFSIYNRWGEQVFITKNPRERWNGIAKADQLSTFTWIATYQFNGSTKRTKQGTIVVLK